MPKGYGNLTNFRAMPLIENYWGKYRAKRFDKESNRYKFSDEPEDFQYTDGTSDSYVKRGFDEEYIQAITRYEGLEQSYRIMTTNNNLDFAPGDKVIIGNREMHIQKVLPLLNTNDNIRMYNFSADIYRDMAVKLIYLL